MAAGTMTDAARTGIWSNAAGPVLLADTTPGGIGATTVAARLDKHLRDLSDHACAYGQALPPCLLAGDWGSFMPPSALAPLDGLPLEGRPIMPKIYLPPDTDTDAPAGQSSLPGRNPTLAVSGGPVGAREFPRVVTLGPPGTDAAHAARHFAQTILACSFPLAMETAWRQDAAALVCTGFIDRRDGDVTDCWVDLHFRWTGMMQLQQCWVEPTKPMGIAVRPGSIPARVGSVALHPATEALAQRWLPQAERRYVSAKPLAVRMAAAGEAEACIGSLDIVAATDLEVVQVIEPLMVWCLYTRSPGVEPSSGTTR